MHSYTRTIASDLQDSSQSNNKGYLEDDVGSTTLDQTMTMTMNNQQRQQPLTQFLDPMSYQQQTSPPSFSNPWGPQTTQGTTPALYTNASIGLGMAPRQQGPRTSTSSTASVSSYGSIPVTSGPSGKSSPAVSARPHEHARSRSLSFQTCWTSTAVCRPRRDTQSRRTRLPSPCRQPT